MHDIENLCDGVWDCKYHVVWLPKCRRKAPCGQIQRRLGETFHELARQRECKILQGHLAPDHVHVYIAIPPKYAVAQVSGFIKAKSPSAALSDHRRSRFRIVPCF